MSPTHRKLVVTSVIVLVVVTACARTSGAGVRRIDLVSTEPTAPALASNDEARLSNLLDGSDPSASVSDPAIDDAPAARNASTGSGAATDGATAMASDEIFVRLIQSALDSADLCGVWDALAQVPLDARVPQSLARQMMLVTEVMELASSVVPSSLSDDWDEVADGFEDVASKLATGATADAVAAYDDPAFAAAQREIASWVGERCG